MTLIVPLLALLGIGIGQIISNASKPPVMEIKTMGYVDEFGNFNRYTTQGYTKLFPFKTSEDATQALISNDISEYFVIPSNYMSNGMIHRYTLQPEIDTPPYIKAVIKSFLTSNLLGGKMPENIVNIIRSQQVVGGHQPG